MKNFLEVSRPFSNLKLVFLFVLFAFFSIGFAAQRYAECAYVAATGTITISKGEITNELFCVNSNFLLCSIVYNNRGAYPTVNSTLILFQDVLENINNVFIIKANDKHNIRAFCISRTIKSETISHYFYSFVENKKL